MGERISPCQDKGNLRALSVKRPVGVRLTSATLSLVPAAEGSNPRGFGTMASPPSLITPASEHSPQSPFQRTLLTENEAASYLGFARDTLRVWRSKSRRARKLIGPKWVELGGEGRARAIRYRLDDLIAYASRGVVALEPPKRKGRPRMGGAR